jgi:hypothetical protein
VPQVQVLAHKQVQVLWLALVQQRVLVQEPAHFLGWKQPLQVQDLAQPGALAQVQVQPRELEQALERALVQVPAALQALVAQQWHHHTQAQR